MILNEAAIILSNGETVKTFGLSKETRARLKAAALAQAKYAIESVKKGIHTLPEIKKIYTDTIRDELEKKYYLQWFNDEIEKSGIKVGAAQRKKINKVYAEISELTPAEQEEAREWLLNNTKNLTFRIPKVDTDLYTKIDIEGKTPQEIDEYIRKTEIRFANAEAEFHERIPQATKGHGFKYRRVSQESDTNYDFWRISGVIVFKQNVLDAPDSVKKLIELGLATSRKHNDNDQKSIDEMGNVVNNYYFCLSVVKLFNGDVEFYKVNPVDNDNPFDTDFDESLNEEEELCCICGEPINGYGNNAEPYKSGRCCDACNLKFVIPYRFKLMQQNENLTED